MKTKVIATKKIRQIPLILTALIFISFSCDKIEPVLPGESLAYEDAHPADLMTETFWVTPLGSSFNLFNGEVSLKFPAGAVIAGTEFTLISFPLYHLEDLADHNLYKRGYSLFINSTSLELEKSIRILLSYDLKENSWLRGKSPKPDNITVFEVSPSFYSLEYVLSIGDCKNDISNKQINGWIAQCGSYVLGEN